MTMKKLGLSLVAASVVAVSAQAAGSLTLYSGSVGKMSKELIDSKTVDTNLTKPLLYTNGMLNASASEVGFDLRIPGATLKSSSGTNLKIAVMDGESYPDENLTVAQFDRFDTTQNAIIFKAVAGTSIARGKKYKIVTDDDSVDNNATYSHVGTIANGDLEVTINQGSSAVQARLIAIDNTGVTQLDDVTADILKAENQFDITIDQQLSASIDAANAFKIFTTVDGLANTATTDELQFTFENLRDSFEVQAIASEFRLDVVADQNISAYAITTDNPTSSSPGGNAFDTATVTDANITYIETADADGNFSAQTTATLTTDETEAMSDTVFKATGVVTFDGGATVKPLDKADAGQWTIYGYNAQIPDVMPTDAYVTYIKLTNRSSIDAGVYFTLIDQDGTIVTVDSDNDGISALAKDKTVKYKAADLAAIATAKDANFDAARSISIEVSVPTTPSKVYGFTSLRNNALGQFKDLPMYNNSDRTY